MKKVEQQVIDAAQRFSDAMARCEYWRVLDVYPYPEHKAAWDEQQAALSTLMKAAQLLPTTQPQPQQPQEGAEP